MNDFSNTKTEIIPGQHHIELSEIHDKIWQIVSKFQPEKIILFGSQTRGDTTLNSDIDLLVIIPTRQSTVDLAAEISLSLKHSIPMDIIVRTPQQITKRLKQGDFFIKNIIENGKVLYERNS